MRNYGDFGKPIMLLEAYDEWRADKMEYLQEAEQQGLQLEEADTRFDFTTFLYGPMRTSLYEGYEEVEGDYRWYARVENLPDFRERRIQGLNSMSRPGYTGEHGEAIQMRRTERPPASLIVDTYSGTYSMTRHLIINDESNELMNTAPREMGRASKELILESTVAFVESNPTAPDGNPTYSTGRGNQLTVELSEDSLALALAAMTKQRDDNNRRIRVTPRTLLVGDPRWELVADRILHSTETGVRTASESSSRTMDKGTLNPLARNNLARNLSVQYDAYLSDANDWYLFGDQQRWPAFAIGFLNGQEAPRVYLKNPELRNALGGGGQDPYTFELRSLDWLVEFDYGLAAVDPRGTFRSTPA